MTVAQLRQALNGIDGSMPVMTESEGGYSFTDSAPFGVVRARRCLRYNTYKMHYPDTHSCVDHEEICEVFLL